MNKKDEKKRMSGLSGLLQKALLNKRVHINDSDDEDEDDSDDDECASSASKLIHQKLKHLDNDSDDEWL